MITEKDALVIGPPGGLTFWAFEVLRALAKKNLEGPVDVVTVGVAQPVPAPVEHTAGRLLLTNYPGVEFIEAIERINVPVLYLSEEPSRVVNYLKEKTNRTNIEAVRVCSASYSANLALRKGRKVAVLDRDMDVNLPDLLRAICAHLNLNIEASEILSYAAHLTPKEMAEGTLGAAVRKFEGVADRPASIDELAEILIPSVLDPLAALTTRHEVTAVVWPRNAFYSAERPTEMAPSSIDLMGPARMLVHGPYLHLPPGQYRAEILVDLFETERDSSFRLELHAGEVCLKRVRFASPAAGRFAAAFEFLHPHAGPELQAQIITERGALDGKLSLLQISFLPQL
ncbi:hypothetical protein [Hyphomicrobium sp. 2TAF46]|uniref:hypothetical protein n=1 Tax=Hyphomicrobium sp. 2TAF46 TaxID=3233019 RepID=UPI003F8DD559